MSKQVQLRRGTTAENATFTGAQGEVVVDITKKALVVHDGSTAGGYPQCPIAGPGSSQAFAVGALSATKGIFGGTGSPTGIVQSKLSASDSTVISGVTSDYVHTSIGSRLLVDMGEVTGNTYSRISALTTGGTAWGNLVLQSGGGAVLIGTTTSDGINKVQVNGGVSMTGKLTYAAGNVATTAASGTNGAPPAQVAGYIIITIAGIDRKIPYYSN